MKFCILHWDFEGAILEFIYEKIHSSIYTRSIRITGEKSFLEFVIKV